MIEKLTLKDFCKTICDSLIKEINEGTSFFQRYYDAKWQPILFAAHNPFTRMSYNAFNSLVLSLKKFDDPRYISADEAMHAGLSIKLGEQGTIIDFSDDAITSFLDPFEFSEDKTKNLKGTTHSSGNFEQFFQAGIVFNASQFESFPASIKSGKMYWDRQPQYPYQFIDLLIANSHAQFNRSTNSLRFDWDNDVIYIPEKDMFKTDQQFYRFAVNSLIEWSGHKSRLNRPVTSERGPDSMALEELNTLIASRILGDRLKVGFDTSIIQGDTNQYARILEENPLQIFKSCMNAQRTVSLLNGILDGKQVAKERKLHKSLVTGEEIPYVGTIYRVLRCVASRFEIERVDTGAHVWVSKSDVLYGNLINARNSDDIQLKSDHTMNQNFKARQGRQR